MRSLAETLKKANSILQQTVRQFVQTVYFCSNAQIRLRRCPRIMADWHHSNYNPLILLTSDSEPTNFYPSSSDSTQSAKHLPNSDDVNKRALLIHVIEHWKWKTSEHQHPAHEPSCHSFTYQSSSPATVPSNKQGTYSASNEMQANTTDKSHRRDDFTSEVGDDDDRKTIATIKKRDRPLPTSSKRRKEMSRSHSALSESINSKLLTPQHNNRLASGSSGSKKSHKAAPIFIAPKKFSSPSYSSPGNLFDDCLRIGQKPILKRQSSFNDADNTGRAFHWTPAPPPSSSRFPVGTIMPSQRNSNDDDSGDENVPQSLLIRDNRTRKKPVVVKPDSRPHLFLPSTILITDPSGLSHVFDPDFDMQETNNVVPGAEENTHSIDTNTLGPNSIFNYESALPDVIIIPPTPPVIHNKHKLQSIGEELEEEEDDEEQAEEKPTSPKDKIFSRELDRFDVLSRSRQAMLSVQPPIVDPKSTDNDREPLTRRWSDSFFDRDQEISSPPTAKPLKKPPSILSMPKLPIPTTVKVSLGKYLLMKLHLTSNSKDEPTDLLLALDPAKKRTVRRSPNRKRYQTH